MPGVYEAAVARFKTLQRALDLYPNFSEGHRKQIVKGVLSFCRFVVEASGRRGLWTVIKDSSGNKYREANVDAVYHFVISEDRVYDYLVDWVKERLSKLRRRSIDSYYYSVTFWLRENGYNLDYRCPEKRDRLRRVLRHVMSSTDDLIPEDQEWIPTLDELRMIVDALESPRDKFIITFLAESGMRPETFIKLKIGDLVDDIWEDKSCYAVRVERSIERKRKNRKGRSRVRYAFFGPDAAFWLRIYLEERKKGGEKLTDDRPLVLSEKTGKAFRRADYLNQILHKAIEKIPKLKSKVRVYQASNGQTRYSHRIHQLRKFAQSKLELVIQNPNIINLLMGRDPVEAEGKSYSRHDLEELRREYLKALNHLLIHREVRYREKTVRFKVEVESVTEDRRVRELENRILDLEQKLNDILEGVVKPNLREQDIKMIVNLDKEVGDITPEKFAEIMEEKNHIPDLVIARDGDELTLESRENLEKSDGKICRYVAYKMGSQLILEPLRERSNAH